MNKYHVQATGAKIGELVACNASIACRLSAESEHLYFEKSSEAKEYSELLAAKEAGGAFGGGLSESQRERIAKLDSISKLNRTTAFTQSTTSEAQPGPPLPEKFYHVARRADLNSILANGLKPAIGERSEDFGEEVPRVYLFDSRISAEDGGNWLADEFDEDEELVLLSIDSNHVEKPVATYIQEDASEESGYAPSSEWTSEALIDPKIISYEGEY